MDNLDEVVLDQLGEPANDLVPRSTELPGEVASELPIEFARGRVRVRDEPEQCIPVNLGHLAWAPSCRHNARP
jgi:hypothetical protein